MFTKSPIEPNVIYTRQETAHLLGISLSTLKQLIRTRQLRVSQPAGLRRVFIRGAHILEMLERSERLPDSLDFRSAVQIPFQNDQILDPKQSLRAKQAAPRHALLVSAKKSARASGGANR